MQNEKANAEAAEDMADELSGKDTEKILRHHVYASLGVGLIPIPVVDFIGLTAVQINMLRKIAGVYDVPFFKDTVKNVLSSFVGGAIPTVAGPLAASMTKTVPFVGQLAGAVTMPIVAGATTYAVGKVFIQHFASGGTFLTFNPEKVKSYYEEMFSEGEKVAAEMNKKKN